MKDKDKINKLIDFLSFSAIMTCDYQQAYDLKAFFRKQVNVEMYDEETIDYIVDSIIQKVKENERK